MKKCKYNDCGWCYAPDGLTTNDDNGQCNNPLMCDQMITENWTEKDEERMEIIGQNGNSGEHYATTAKRPIVIIESPYAGDVERNVKYAQLCMADALHRGEAPFASHLLYTQPNVLDDNKPDERKLGIEAGFAFKHVPGAVTVFYTDLGMTEGMSKALDYCRVHGLPRETRSIAECVDITCREDGKPGSKILKQIPGLD